MKRLLNGRFMRSLGKLIICFSLVLASNLHAKLTLTSVNGNVLSGPGTIAKQNLSWVDSTLFDQVTSTPESILDRMQTFALIPMRFASMAYHGNYMPAVLEVGCGDQVENAPASAPIFYNRNKPELFHQHFKAMYRSYGFILGPQSPLKMRVTENSRPHRPIVLASAPKPVDLARIEQRQTVEQPVTCPNFWSKYYQALHHQISSSPQDIRLQIGETVALAQITLKATRSSNAVIELRTYYELETGERVYEKPQTITVALSMTAPAQLLSSIVGRTFSAEGDLVVEALASTYTKNWKAKVVGTQEDELLTLDDSVVAFAFTPNALPFGIHSAKLAEHSFSMTKVQKDSGEQDPFNAQAATAYGNSKYIDPAKAWLEGMLELTEFSFPFLSNLSPVAKTMLTAALEKIRADENKRAAFAAELARADWDCFNTFCGIRFETKNVNIPGLDLPINLEISGAPGAHQAQLKFGADPMRAFETLGRM